MDFHFQGQYPGSGGYPPQQGGYPPQGGGFPQQGGGFPQQGGGFPQQGGFPPQQGGYPPQGGYPNPNPNQPAAFGGYAPPASGNFTLPLDFVRRTGQFVDTVSFIETISQMNRLLVEVITV